MVELSDRLIRYKLVPEEDVLSTFFMAVSTLLTESVIKRTEDKNSPRHRPPPFDQACVHTLPPLPNSLDKACLEKLKLIQKNRASEWIIKNDN